MAKIEFKGLDEYAKDLGRLAVRSEGLIKYAVYPAAQEALQAIKANTPVDSGDLRDTERLTTFEDKNGFIYTTIIFPGYDEKGVPNPVKARVLESGSSKQPKRPFIRPTMNAIKNQVVETMRKTLDEAIDKAMNGGT